MFGLKKLYDWMCHQVTKPYALILLSFLFFIESSVFIIPVDPLLILFCLENRSRAFFYATIATISSVVGGLVGYIIGYGIWQMLGQLLVHYLFSPQQFETALSYFKTYESAAVFIAGFTPIPYKLITISAGFCKLPLITFIIYSCLGRGARFYLLAYGIKLWGNYIKEYIDRYFNLFVILFTLMIFVGLWFAL